MSAYLFDIEGDSLGELVLKKGEVASIEAMNVWLLVMKDIHTGKEYVYRRNEHEDTIAEGWERLKKARTVIGHNIFDYDLPVMRRLYGGDVEGKVIDTLVMARLMWPDAKDHPYGGNGLDNLSQAAGGVTKQKYDGGFERWSPEMESYCLDDVRANLSILKFLKRKGVGRYRTALKLEHRVADIIGRQKANGVSINLTKAEELIDFFELEAAECRDALDKVFPVIHHTVTQKSQVYVDPYTNIQYDFKKNAPKEVQHRLEKGPFKTKIEEEHFNPGSTQQVARRMLDRHGWVAPTTRLGNASVTEDTLLSLDYPEAKYLVRFNMAKKRLEHLRDWVMRARNCRTPGRIHPSINTNGAATGRMTHSQPNQTACPRASHDKDDNPILGYAGRYGVEMRALWGPREGWLQVGGDASGLELRLLGAHLKPYDRGLYIRSILDGDIHTSNMEWGGLDTRNQSKETAYAFFYGSGDVTLGETISSHQSLTPEQRRKYLNVDPRKIGQKYKRTFKRRVKGLSSLMDWCKTQAEQKGYMVLPDGRRVPIRKSYAALNTLLQGTGGIVMKLALVFHHDALIARGWKWDEDFSYMLNAHDEFQLECRPEIAHEVGRLIVESIERAGRAMKIACPLTGEYKVGANWSQTH